MTGDKRSISLFETDEDRAVSPVIGVILMVAITVILAAVIGTFVLDLGEDVETNVQAGATVDKDGDSIVVSWTSNQNADTLEITAEDLDDSTLGTETGSISSVGGTFVIDCTSFDGTDISGSGDRVKVSVVATTDEGNEDVIVDPTETC